MATPAKILDQNLPTVAIVGRVNVGKSTLFNKMAGSGKALVSKIPGTTRTKNIDLVNWRGKNFRLVDTGGLTFSDNVPLEQEIIRQSEMALEMSDLVIFLVDIKTGVLPQERELAKRLQKGKYNTILAANKADNKNLEVNAYNKEWLKLGFGKPFPVSAATGLNVGDLLDEIIKRLGKSRKHPKTAKEIQSIRISIIGKPNVGKSSLFNALIGKEEVIVSEMPHTTREPFDTLVLYEKQPLLFVDTAGIRRKANVAGEIEHGGVMKSLEMIKKSDIVLLVLDASEPISSQDQQLGGLLRERSKSTIIIVNKWDLAEENSDAFRNDTRKTIYATFPHLDFAPIVFVSAKSKYRVHQIFPLIKEAWEGRQQSVSQENLNKFLREATREHRPARGKGTRHPKLLGFSQIHSNPPIFEMLIKSKTSLHYSYVHYLENKLREKFGFFATPIVIKLTKLKRDL